MSERQARLTQANAILKMFAPEMTLESRKGRLWLKQRYPNWPAGDMDVCADLNGQGDRLRWGRRLAFGGTCNQATVQLIRWVKDQPRLPLSAWGWWCSRQVQLADDRGPELIQALGATSYVDLAKTACVLCGAQGVSDWWSLDKVTGPCCAYKTGCRQTGDANA